MPVMAEAPGKCSRQLFEEFQQHAHDNSLECSLHLNVTHCHSFELQCCLRERSQRKQLDRGQEAGWEAGRHASFLQRHRCKLGTASTGAHVPDRI